ncbi:BppU family phage baseplate upper protein [Bacillus sp. ISL-37]|uniref:BppU family phage baseplate upper protein n=1 Tax=Bacillus sp. ISL-37 TaxID=2819123 RepID=UPI001BEBBF26|nr:BppU family phage baseplate upper protein [Bacillus sp. ISL-37]MBT2682672.1 hypothetical protein [Bacillus sp. ISL-37]
MADIKIGDNGTVLQFPIVDGGVEVSLAGASVDIVIKAGDRRLVKPANISDPSAGICEVTLGADDLASAGLYVVQGVVKLPNGKEFASDVVRFSVSGRI